MDNKRTLEVLKKVTLFAGLDKRNLEVLSRIVVARHYDKGETIVRQGENGIAFYVIEAGKVEVFRERDNQKIKLNQLGESDFFGEMALFEEAPRSASVVTLEPTDCYILTHWNFKSAIEDNPTIAVQMLPIIIKRFSKAAEEFL